MGETWVDTRVEFQPAASIFRGWVPPDETAGITISGGRVKPFFFYLGGNSTVPFIRLESPVTSKEISWGDVVELPPGASVNVRNISYMPGDIQIQSGNIPVASPGRITIPTECEVFSTTGGDLEVTRDFTIRPKFPCDTRRARRAYFCFSLSVFSAVFMSCSCVVSGYYKQHTKNPQTPVKESYRDSYIFNTVPEIVPLGISFEGNAMRLSDFSTVEVIVKTFYAEETTEAKFVDAFYVVEY